MKFAIFFFGHTRHCYKYFEYHKENIINILVDNGYEFDVFLITYSDILNEKNIRKDLTEETNKSIEHIKNLLGDKIKKIKILTQNQEYIDKFDAYDDINVNSHTRTISCNLRHKKCQIHKDLCKFRILNNLLEIIDNVDSYDYILTARYDTILKTKLDLSNIDKYDFISTNCHRNAGNQMDSAITFGKTKFMKKFLQFYDKIKEDDYKLVDDFNRFYKINVFKTCFLIKFYIVETNNIKVWYSNNMYFFMRDEGESSHCFKVGKHWSGPSIDIPINLNAPYHLSRALRKNVTFID